MHTLDESYHRLEEKNRQAESGGGKDKIEKQHQANG